MGGESWNKVFLCNLRVVSMYISLVDTKNSVGLVGCIEEVAHNAIAVYWNPLESAAKVRNLNLRRLCSTNQLSRT